jgi:hypothetical protein
MREQPIILRDWQVRAVLDGRMTTVRTPIRPQPPAGLEVRRKLENLAGDHGILFTDRDGELSGCEAWPYYFPSRVGDRLWCQECWCRTEAEGGEVIVYRADHSVYLVPYPPPCPQHPHGPVDWTWDESFSGRPSWRSSAAMPRWASRIDLEVTAVRVERLQEIKFHEIRSEGVDCPTHDGDGCFCCSECSDLRAEYAARWDSHYPKFPWSTNPWVLVREFKRVDSALEVESRDGETQAGQP